MVISARWWKRLGLVAAGMLLMLAALVWFAPTLLGYGPVRDFLLGALFQGGDVQVTYEELSLGWFRPTKVTGLKISHRHEQFEFTLPEVTNDRRLFSLILNPRQLGNLTIESPSILIVLSDEGLDLADSALAKKPPLNAEQLQDALSRSIDIEIRNASLTVQNPGHEPWGFAGIQLQAKLRPGENVESGPVFYLPRAQLMDHQQLTQEMCADLLKFAAPVVNDVTKIEGEVSLELRDFEIPLAQREQAVGQGTLSIHQARLTGSDLVRMVTELLRIESSTEIITDCKIEFKLANRQVYHEGLDFGIGDLRVRTRGYVGLDDESLDIVAEVTIPVGQNDSHGPLLQALRGKSIQIPIGGTLEKPLINEEQLVSSLVGLAESTLRNVLQNEDISLDFAGENVEDITELAQSLMQSIRENREANGGQGILERLRNRSEGNPGRPGIFGGLFRRGETPDQPDSTPPADSPAEPLPDADGALDL